MQTLASEPLALQSKNENESKRKFSFTRSGYFVFFARLDGRSVVENSSDARAFKRQSHSLDQRDCQSNADRFEQRCFTDFQKIKTFSEPVREVETNIFVLNPLAIPTYGNEAVRKFNQKFLVSQVKKAMRKLNFQKPLNMVFNPAAGLLAGKLGEEKIVYYCVDEYTAFTGAASGLQEIEEELFSKSDLVIVSAEKLFDDKKKYNENTHIITTRHGLAAFSHRAR